MERPYIKLSAGKVGTASLLFKRAAGKNSTLLRKKELEDTRLTKSKIADLYITPPSVTVIPVAMGGVPCEWVRYPDSLSDKALVYIHGGSWAFGGLKTARPVSVMLAEQSGIQVLAVEYRLAPEHHFPAGLEDCCKVYRTLLDEGLPPENIAVFGDSAGGNLSLALLHMLKAEGEALPAAVACASPATNLTKESPLASKLPDLLLTQYQGIEWDNLTLYAGEADRAQSFLSPVFGDMSGFPPILIHVGEDEDLCTDNIAFAKAAYACGVDIVCKVWREMFHDFTIVGITLKESRESVKEIAAFLRKQLKIAAS